MCKQMYRDKVEPLDLLIVFEDSVVIIYIVWAPQDLHKFLIMSDDDELEIPLRLTCMDDAKKINVQWGTKLGDQKFWIVGSLDCLLGLVLRVLILYAGVWQSSHFRGKIHWSTNMFVNTWICNKGFHTLNDRCTHDPRSILPLDEKNYAVLNKITCDHWSFRIHKFAQFIAQAEIQSHKPALQSYSPPSHVGGQGLIPGCVIPKM